MDKETLAPFALPPEQQVFGQPTPSEPAPAAEPQKRRRGRPPASEQAKAAATPAKRGRKPVTKTSKGFTVEHVRILRRLSGEEFGVVTTIMERVPSDSWIAIGNALMDIAKLNSE